MFLVFFFFFQWRLCPIAVNKCFKKGCCENDNCVIVLCGIYFWELERQVLSTLVFQLVYLSGVSGCLENALCVLTQGLLITESGSSTVCHCCFPLRTGLEDLNCSMERKIRGYSRAGHKDKFFMVCFLNLVLVL